MRQAAPLPETVFLRQGDTSFCVALRSHELAPESVQNRCIITSISLRMRMADGVSSLNGAAYSGHCRIGLTEQPECPRHQGHVSHAGILAGGTRRQSVFLAARVERFEGPFDYFVGTAEMSHEETNHSLTAHGVEQRWSVTARAGEIKQTRNRFLGQRQLAANDARGGQPEHDLKLLGGSSEALAQFTRAGEGCHRLV